MTTVAVLCDPPRTGVLPDLDRSPLSQTDCSALYAAMCADTVRAVEASAADLLVNYRADDEGPPEDLRTVVRDALDDPDEARFEPQVGSTFSGRVGNTLTHLLETEDESAVVAVEPTAPFLARGDLDGLAMKLRRNDVILGPASNGRVYAAAFGAPIDFADAYTAPAVTTLTDRALDAGLDVDYAPMLPVVESPGDLAGALALVEARERAGRRVPEQTVACLTDLGITLTTDDGEPTISRPDTDRS
ncbi:hypothetical protein [Halococcus hamelinensis]|uniref:DUF2064 domain-containing protein n=1 Tax=Halococcus hamelinensis 100A6 TaxID=1132509 RepID=M0M1C4_9EURY|nr:hypothetical protein [Halococcus hamelinensis]EMA38404.1 hypothetical protein C447_09617 [Halococcus hamelinensis 100A6]